MPILRRKIAYIAAIVSARDGTFSVSSTGTSRCSIQNRRSRTSLNSVCSANQTARLRITPTTDAVIAASAPARARLARRTEEDPQEAGHEGNPGREQAREH